MKVSGQDSWCCKSHCEESCRDLMVLLLHNNEILQCLMPGGQDAWRRVLLDRSLQKF